MSGNKVCNKNTVPDSVFVVAKQSLREEQGSL